MFLFVAGQSSFNTGDAIVQLILFLVLLSVPVSIVFLFVSFRKQSKKSRQLEERVDKLLDKNDESS
ncbi:hypothetical protein [Halobacillus hunanensis]|uniref:hypothetical protein n=1 Tax=Halobacillus hunanensis TaxID=578214 RepID=UPI0009A8D5EC|nr:hypothetical protein [Halobacillus hunanensis]